MNFNSATCRLVSYAHRFTTLSSLNFRFICSQNICMINLLFYSLQNAFKKFCIFLRQEKISDRIGENIS